MTFRRMSALTRHPSADVLTHDMVGIGMNFAAKPARDPNIEDTLRVPANVLRERLADVLSPADLVKLRNGTELIITG